MDRPTKVRGPYRGDYRETLAGVERERRELGISIAELAGRAGMSERKLNRARRTGLAFRRDVNALRMAIREIKKQQRQQVRLFRREGTSE